MTLIARRQTPKPPAHFSSPTDAICFQLWVPHWDVGHILITSPRMVTYAYAGQLTLRAHLRLALVLNLDFITKDTHTPRDMTEEC